MRKTLAVLLSIGMVALGQQPPAPPRPAGGQQQTPQTPTDGAATFTSNTQLVVETITVKDKSGKTIDNLTAKDFAVTEDGNPQQIAFVEHQQFEETAETPMAPSTAAVAPRAKYNHMQIQQEKPGDIKYRDRRLLALYFDLSAMPVPDQLRALAAADKFVRTQITPADLVAIMMYSSGAVNVLEDFTADRDRLLATIQTLVVGEDDNAVDAADQSDKGAAFGQDDSEFNLFTTDRQLSAIQTAVKMLGQLSEKKSLVYFASGLMLNGTNNQAQLHSTINAAVRAGVTLFPVDARGLVASAPMGDASKASPGGVQMYNGGGMMAQTQMLQRSQDTMWTLGADTGGKAFLDFNDLSLGIVQAQKSFSSYYILGYYSNNSNTDGKFRRIKITLTNGLQASLDFRQGYYANKVFTKYTSAEKDRQLEEAFMLGDPITELTLALETGYFQLNKAEYFVPVTVKVPGSEFALAKRGGAEHALIDFMGEIKDDFGTTVSNIREKVDVKLMGFTAEDLVKRPLAYDTGFTLLPGKYKIKLLARDLETGRIGTYEAPFVIPNLNKEENRIPISSVVLSSQRQDMREAVFNATKDKDKAQAQQIANPLIQDGQKLMPSVTRVFSRSKNMYVYLQAYEQGAETTRPLMAFVTFYRGQTKAFETAPVAVTDAVTNRLKTIPLQFSFPLEKLSPGEYNFQVTVLDPAAQKAAFWQSQVMLVP
jgi:VWFA-related protein